MVRWPKERGLPVALALLTLLLGVLAVLQYRWTSEIGRADAERRHAQLRRSARSFAANLDQELRRLYQSFLLPPGPAPDARESAYLERFAAWRRTSDHPELVQSLLLASRRAQGAPLLEECDGDPPTCRPADWPASLEPLRTWLATAGDDRSPRDVLSGRPPRMLEEPLSLVLPTLSPVREPGAGPRGPRLSLTGLVLVRLDAKALSEQVLPQLAESSFGPLDGGEYSVAVVRSRDQAILYASDPALAPSTIARPDLRVGLLAFPPGRPGPWERGFGAGRFEPGRFERRGGAPPGAEPRRGEPDEEFERRPPDDGPPPPTREGPWLLAVRHRGGSLEDAVAAVRRRNLAVGLGVLGLLGAAAFVLTTSAQRARRLARQQLEFVAGVTHELHTPLAAIRSAGQNLADGIVTDPPRVRRYGDLIQKEGSRLTTLVAQVLDFAGIESGTRAFAPEPVALGPLVERVAGDVALVLEESGMALETDVPDDLPAVHADPAALSRVLENLITNAVKFAAQGGWIGLSARPGSGGSTVLLQVEDRGPGIPASERTHVFDPFYRGQAARERQVPGSGLGLSLVRHVVESQGGKARVEPGTAGGTRIVLELKV
jgi:signal transduction histidine kinase